MKVRNTSFNNKKEYCVTNIYAAVQDLQTFKLFFGTPDSLTEFLKIIFFIASLPGIQHSQVEGKITLLFYFEIAREESYIILISSRVRINFKSLSFSWCWNIKSNMVGNRRVPQHDLFEYRHSVPPTLQGGGGGVWDFGSKTSR